MISNIKRYCNENYMRITIRTKASIFRETLLSLFVLNRKHSRLYTVLYIVFPKDQIRRITFNQSESVFVAFFPTEFIGDWQEEILAVWDCL